MISTSFTGQRPDLACKETALTGASPPSTTLTLLRARRFAPLFGAQFLGAMNDHLFRTALIFLLVYQLYATAPHTATLWSTVAGGLLILPFFFLSALAGQWADVRDKAAIARWVKLAELAIMALGGLSLLSGSLPFMLGILLLIGVHSAFFGPVKYAILPQHLPRQELLLGAGLVEGGTFVAILLGQMLGGLLSAQGAALGIVVLALGGWLCARAIPPAPPVHAGQALARHPVRLTRQVLRTAFADRVLKGAILGASFFWALGAVMTAQLPALAHTVIGGQSSIATLFLAAFSIGVAGGSLLANRLLRGDIATRHTLWAALALTGFLMDLACATSAYPRLPASANSVGDFLLTGAGLRVLLDLTGLAVAGGVFIVPLYGLLQTHGPVEARAQTIAANNIVNAAFVVIGTGIAAAVLAVGGDLSALYGLFALLAGLMTLLCIVLNPAALVQPLLYGLFRLLYRVEVRGLEHYRSLTGPALLIANHVSLLDGPLLLAALPGRHSAAIDTDMAARWWIKPLNRLTPLYRLDPTRPLATKAMIKALRAGERLVIFPEGRLSTTGGLMKIYEGTGLLAALAAVPVVPLHIAGAQYTPFGALKNHNRRRWFPKIILTLGPPQSLTTPITPERGRTQATAAIRTLLQTQALRATPPPDSLLAALEAAPCVARAQLQDQRRQPLTGSALIRHSRRLIAPFQHRLAPGTRVGLHLPAPESLIAACALSAAGYDCSLLDPRNPTPPVDVLLTHAPLQAEARACYGDALPLLDFDQLPRHRPWRGIPAAATINGLTPKALLWNVAQIALSFPLGSQDRVFCTTPLHRPDTLVAGLLLPLLAGAQATMSAPAAPFAATFAYDTDTTLLIADAPALAALGETAHSYDFYALRHVLTLTGPVPESTRTLWARRFGLRLFDGHSAPLITHLRTPMDDFSDGPPPPLVKVPDLS